MWNYEIYGAGVNPPTQQQKKKLHNGGRNDLKSYGGELHTFQLATICGRYENLQLYSIESKRKMWRKCENHFPFPRWWWFSCTTTTTYSLTYSSRSSCQLFFNFRKSEQKIFVTHFSPHESYFFTLTFPSLFFRRCEIKKILLLSCACRKKKSFFGREYFPLKMKR